MAISLRSFLATLACFSAGLISVTAAIAQVNVLTSRYDNHRTGANLAETTLNPSDATYGAFGKLAVRTLDAQAYVQPLLVSGINVGGKMRNVLYVVTSALDAYAYDADDFSSVNPLWHTSLTSKTRADIYGILSTPVIDPVSGTMYVVTRTLEGPTTSWQSYVFRLWGVNIYTGAILSSSGQQITATVPGTGDNSTSGYVTFNGKLQQQRAALLLSNGYLYVCFGSNGDIRPYHGWIFVYNPQTFAQVGVDCINPNSGPSGIWGSGSGPAVDDNGNIYFTTGNGTGNDSTSLLGDSVLQFSGDGNLTLLNRFTPYNVQYLNQYNLDLGSTGPVCIPGTPYIVTGCKQGKLYLLNGTNLGGLAQNDNNAIAAFDDEIHGSPVYYNGSNGPLVYCWSEDDYLKAFQINNGALVATPFAQSTFMAAQGSPGGFLALSANASDPTSALLWSNMPYIGTAGGGNLAPGVLRVFNPNTLQELWNSYTNLVDDTGYYSKNLPPVVANGKVYIVNSNGQGNRLYVYGLLNISAPQPPQSLVVVPRPGVVRLFWLQNPNTTSYAVYRASKPSGPFVAIATAPQNSYTDTSVKLGASYYYYVVALNSASSSGPSTTVGTTYSSATHAALDYTSFTSSTGLKLNGNANVASSALNLTNGTAGARGSAFYATGISPDEFKTTFTFRLTGPSVYGLTFVAQYDRDGAVEGTSSIGWSGNELGFGPDTSTGRGVEESVGIKFVNGGANNSSTGILYNGRDPGFETDSLVNSGIDFSTGDVFQANVTYDGMTLSCTITDITTGANVTHSYPVNMYSPLYSPTGYFGFTGSADAVSMPSVLTWSLSQ